MKEPPVGVLVTTLHYGRTPTLNRKALRSCLATLLVFALVFALALALVFAFAEATWRGIGSQRCDLEESPITLSTGSTHLIPKEPE